jgi:hypothetical protein
VYDLQPECGQGSHALDLRRGGNGTSDAEGCDQGDESEDCVEWRDQECQPGCVAHDIGFVDDHDGE